MQAQHLAAQRATGAAIGAMLGCLRRHCQLQLAVLQRAAAARVAASAAPFNYHCRDDSTVRSSKASKQAESGHP